ncbi:hypothetical protein F5887DRAFT_1071691 [Amanita rubescens]|nr:hypothetical protein F5887DRAFT_1078878 [Amanita rubescens]KAF8348039.1 hypothetical protein F5887DRAFT_1071691 [Amanita rubescens]
MNMLYSIIPALNPAKKISEKDEPLGDEYILLHAKENARQLPQVEETFYKNHEKTLFTEVQYFFQVLIEVNNKVVKLGLGVMVQTYSDPEPDILAKSHETLPICRFEEDVLSIIDIKTIQAIVRMIPFPLKTEEEKEPELRAKFHNSFYVAEKPFFELTTEGIRESNEE